jgi:hypothetical protein
MKPITYICGPMSGLPDFNYPAFTRAAQQLRERGLTVFNPAENGLPSSAPWSQHMRVDIRMLMGCDRVVTLPGHRGSKGAALEVHIARALGMPVLTLAQALQQSAATTTTESTEATA